MITAEQRELRRKYVGSSDAAAIMGLDPYRSAGDVWLEKTGKTSDRETNDAMEAGNFLESAVLDWFEQTYGKPLVRDVFRSSGQRCANLDAHVMGQPEIVEAKTTGITGPADAGYGEAETDVVPDRVIVQTHHQLGVLGDSYGIVWVPVLIGGKGFVRYQIDRNNDLVEAIALQVESFWTKFVVRDIRPDDFRPSLETLKRVKREPASSVTVPDAVATKLIRARNLRLRIEGIEADAQAALLTEMGSAEAADFSGGRITYFEFNRKAYTRVVEAGTYRKFGFPKAPKQITNTPKRERELV